MTYPVYNRYMSFISLIFLQYVLNRRRKYKFFFSRFNWKWYRYPIWHRKL